MIRRIRLHNVGVFKNAVVPHDLKRIVLIYGENAGGKTTLAEVLRSLEINDPSIIVRRRKFGTQNDQHITLECDGDPSKIVFKDGCWEEKRLTVKVFDEAFIDDSVYSGLEVGSEHRKSMYYLALGKQGVKLSRDREKLGRDIAQYTKDMKKAAEPISDDQRREISMDEFCNIKEVPNIDTEIEKAKMDLDAIQDADTILNTQEFEKISIPAFDESTIRAILQRDLQDLNTEAADRVARHIESLGNRSEAWIAEGMAYMSDDAKACPFCGQETASASLIEHYRAYFSEAYSNLKRDIEDMFNSICSTHSGDVQITFERTVGANREAGHVWAKYGLKPLSIDTKAIVDDWKSALDAVVKAIEAKRAAPLERIPFDSSVLRSYESHLQLINTINTELDVHNDEIKKKKEMVDVATVESIQNKLLRLEVAKERYSTMTAILCDRYIRAKTAKAEANMEKVRVTRQLEAYRDRAFLELQDRVNRYLHLFSARFTMRSLAPKNISSGSSCSYTVMVDNESISSIKPRSDNVPTIGSTLSTSDRNTLALALFLSSLEGSKNLADATVVIDDPVSSFDDNRSRATVERLRELAENVGQLIILSHKKGFLNKVWRGVDKKQCQSLIVIHSGNGSNISDWDIGLTFNADQAQRQRLLETYVRDKTGDRQKVVETIRPYLEAILEILCAGHYDASKPVGTFLSECKDKCNTTKEILDIDTITELQNIYEYASLSMHGSHIDPENTGISGDELRTYVKRTLAITKLSVSHHC